MFALSVAKSILPPLYCLCAFVKTHSSRVHFCVLDGPVDPCLYLRSSATSTRTNIILAVSRWTYLLERCISIPDYLIVLAHETGVGQMCVSEQPRTIPVILL